MSEQINSGQVEGTETSTSGLLLSVEPLQASAQLDATDGNADTGGPGAKDTSDEAGTDVDSSDESGADTDLTDALGAEKDTSDDTADTDSSDDSASIKIDGKDA